MKKRSFLVFATVATIGMAGAGSYAAWDSLSATSNGTMAVPARIELTAQAMDAMSVTRDGVNSAPIFTGKAIFDLTTANDTTDKKFKLNVSVKNASTEVDTTAYNVSIKKSDTVIPLTDGMYVDTSPTATKITYDVVISLTDTEAAYDLASTNLDVSITGTLAN